MSNITLNIVEPGTGPTPIEPGTEPIVPNTGLFTHGIGGPEATIITISIVAILAIVAAAVLYYKKKHSKDNKEHKANKANKLANALAIAKTKKKVSIPLAALALVISLGTLAALLVNAGKSNTNATEATEDTLTVKESDQEFTIELADEPVFAVLPVELTVEEATAAGYTLTAYTEDTNLVSTTDNTNIIPMVAADEGELVALKDNTYGLSLVKPEDKEDEVYTTLSTDQSNPTILKTIDDYSETPANDKTTIYYGFYITPDTPYGTYEGSSIYYEAEPNYITNLSFDGNGSDGGTAIEGMTLVAGDTITLPENTYTRDGYDFTGWNTVAEPTEQDPGESYANQAEYTAVEGETKDVTFYAQWEEACPVNTICYKGNNADPTTNMDNVSQYTTDSSVGKQVDLLASNFTKSGHGFVGWSTDQNAWEDLTDDEESNNPTIYGPNQMITVGNLSNNGMKLYAVWAPAETDNSGNPISLQDWQGCSALTATTYDVETGTLSVGKNTITALTDNRDGNIYTVARLADGNCWMTENLRLDNEATISTTNTNNPVTVDNNVAIKNNDGNASAHLSPTNDSWCTNSDSACYDQSYLNTNNTALTTASPVFNQDFTSSSHANLDDKISSYGNYYNWYSATAANGTYSKSSGEVAGDICPTGWSLPLGSSNNTSGSFYYLNQQMGAASGATGSNNWRSFPNNFVYSGYWGGSSAVGRGRYGYYWSSTAYDTNFAYNLYFGSSYVFPSNYYGKYGGVSVRCVVSQ